MLAGNFVVDQCCHVLGNSSRRSPAATAGASAACCQTQSAALCSKACRQAAQLFLQAAPQSLWSLGAEQARDRQCAGEACSTRLMSIAAPDTGAPHKPSHVASAVDAPASQLLPPVQMLLPFPCVVGLMAGSMQSRPHQQPGVNSSSCVPPGRGRVCCNEGVRVAACDSLLSTHVCPAGCT